MFMAANFGRIDAQIVEQLCRQMQGVTLVCEKMTLKLLEIESRIEQLDSSLQGVDVAIENEGLSELLDAVGDRLGDLKGLLGDDGKTLTVPEAVVTSGEELLDGQIEGDGLVAEEQDLHSCLNDEHDEGTNPEAIAKELDTIYVDDPQLDLMSA